MGISGTHEPTGYFLSRNSLITSKDRVSSLDLDLDLDVDVDGFVRGKPSRHNIYQIALYRLSVHVHVQVQVQVEVQVRDGGSRSFTTDTSYTNQNKERFSGLESMFLLEQTGNLGARHFSSDCICGLKTCAVALYFKACAPHFG